MNLPEEIKTNRLILRIPSISDAAAIFNSYAQDEEVTRFMTWHPHKNIHETKSYLENCITAWKSNIRFPYAVILNQSAELIGMIEIRINTYKSDVGYVISRKHWGNGYATEALQLLVKSALSNKEIYRVWAVCDVDNLASARVLEKVGMQREGILRRNILHPNLSSEPRDCYCYSIVK